LAKRDFYDILGVSRSASAEELRKAHRKLVRQYHPDVNKNNPHSEEKFKEVQEAYDVLSDETKRRNYDQFGHDGVGAGGARGPGVDPFEAFRRAQGARSRGGGQWQPEPGVHVQDFDAGDGGQFADIFEQFFGQRAGGQRPGGRRGQPRPTPPRGQDIEYPVTLTFAQAARGMTLPLQINRDGKLETIDIKVPAGVKEGSRVRIKGRGQQAGGEPGDLFIVTKVLPHPYFRRDGLDVYLDLPISIYDALLGTKIEVPTLDGNVTLTISPGTSGGSKLRIKGRGAQRGGEKGDQFVITRVIVPKILDEEDQTAIRKLQEKYPLNARADVHW